MTVFSVTYDLNKDKDYEKLWAELEKFNGHKAALSFFFVDVNTNEPHVLLDHLNNYIDDDDRLVVSRVDVRPATQRAFKGTKDWLDRRFP
ncbi:MAG: hypothetical protein Q8K97_03025 [Pseudohongiella sp.]|nr:hypothetical protein [Pseudohongiella sp.]